MSSSEKIKNNIIYNTADVATGFFYWQNKLKEVIYHAITIDGLIDSLDKEFLLETLIIDGYCILLDNFDFLNGDIGNLGFFRGGLTGVNMYLKPTKVTYTAPTVKGCTRDIGKGCEVIYSSPLKYYNKQPLIKLINRYARQLADIDSSINIAVVNTRLTDNFSASDTAVAESLKAYIKEVRAGRFAVITDTPIFENVKKLPQSSPANLNSLYELRDYLLKAFYREIGLNLAFNKKERLITDELTGDDQLLKFNIDTIIDSINESFKICNATFKLNLKATFNYNIISDIEEKSDNEKKGGEVDEG